LNYTRTRGGILYVGRAGAAMPAATASVVQDSTTQNSFPPAERKSTPRRIMHVRKVTIQLPCAYIAA